MLKLEEGNFYLYFGQKLSIQGEVVECIRARRKGISGLIKLVCPVDSKYDSTKWYCSSRYLKPYKYKRTPDWEI
jgi:hypothetical protein